MISGQALLHHLYAADSPLYVSFASGDSAAALDCLQSCLALVQSWMSMNKLKLNPDKTEFLFIRKDRQWSKYLTMVPIEIFGIKTNPAKSARNLAVIFDKSFTFPSHISVVCSSVFYRILDIRCICHYLDLDSTIVLATALVSSRLECYNVITLRIRNLNKLHRVQNRLAHLVTKSSPFTRSVSLFCSPHWLPVKFKVLFKIRLLTYKICHEKQPVYLQFQLPATLRCRTLRSNKGTSMLIPRVKTNTGARVFHPCTRLSGVCCHFLSVQPLQLLPSRNISRHISLTRPFPHRRWHARWPVDVMKLLH